MQGKNPAFSVNVKEKHIQILALILLALGLFINLGIHPLVLEEPRRAITAMEMLENGNLWVPTFIGEPYYKKPPLFNWVLLFSAGLTGEASEWAFRLPTVLSVLAISLLLFLAGRRYHSTEMGIFSAFLFAISLDILFYFSILAEIDLFYSLVTFGSILSIFHFFQLQRYFSMFAVSYGLSGIGLLTKGLPSLPFLAISIVVFLIYKRRLSLLLSPAHFLGLLLFGLVTGGYFYMYSRYLSPLPFFETLWSESSDRTVLSSVKPSLIRHLLVFPLETLKNLLPGTILLVFAMRKGALTQLRRNEYALFALLLFLPNFLVYWISPGSSQRYIYPVYPLAIIGLTYFYLENQPGKGWREHLLSGAAAFLTVVFAVAGSALPFAPLVKDLPYAIPLSGAMLAFSAALFYGRRRRPEWSLSLIILVFAAARIVFSLTFLPLRANHPEDLKKIAVAREIDRQVRDAPLFILGSDHFSSTMVYYLNRFRGRSLHYRGEIQPGSYYLTADSSAGSALIQTFQFDDRPFYLVKD